MSSKKVLALYNGNEMLLDIEINYDNLYNSFLDIFRQKFNERDPSINKFKLTTINTSIPYLLIDPNNIKSIIEEKIENNAPLKILLTKEEEFDELKKDSMEENFFCGYMKEVSAFEEDFNDEEFIIGDKDTDIDIKVSENQNEKEIKENEKKEEELNRILTKSLSKEINDENIDEKKKENENEAKNDIAIEDMDNLNLNENLRLSSNFNFNSFNNNEYDNNDDNSDDENKKKEKKNDNINNNNKII
jgi:hypothetical protein